MIAVQKLHPAGRAPALLTLGLLVASCAGCSGKALTGRWDLERALPSREVFSLDDVTFKKDGTYSATTTFEGRTAQQQGTFTFNGFKLTLAPAAGGSKTYNAFLTLASKLEVSDGERKVVLRKR